MFNLLGSVIRLLLPLLRTTTQTTIGLIIYRSSSDRHEPKHQVEGRLLLDVVITQGTTILELFAGEDEALLIWRNAENFYNKFKISQGEE